MATWAAAEVCLNPAQRSRVQPPQLAVFTCFDAHCPLLALKHRRRGEMGGEETTTTSSYESGPQLGGDSPPPCDETTTSTPDRSLQRPFDDVETCVICLDTLTEPCRLMPCKHYHYHFACIEAWLSTAPGCPICKTAVSKVVHGPSLEQTSYYSGKPAPPRPFLAATSPPAASLTTPYHTHAVSAPFHRRPQWPARPLWADFVWPTDTEPQGLAFRRDVYRWLRYSKHVGSNPHSGYRELAPADFRDGAVMERVRTFLRRELRVFSWLTAPEADNLEMLNGETSDFFERRKRVITVERMLGHILRLLPHFEILGSDGGLEDMVTRHLGRENTRLLLHELHAWLRSPYPTLDDWDRAVQYDPLPEPVVDIPERRPRQDRFTGTRYAQRYRDRRTAIRPASASARAPAWRGGQRREHADAGVAGLRKR